MSIEGSIPSNEINTAPNYITQQHLHKDIKCARFLSKYDQFKVFADIISLLPLVDCLTISTNSSPLLLVLLSTICSFSPVLSFKMATCWTYFCEDFFQSCSQVCCSTLIPLYFCLLLVCMHKNVFNNPDHYTLQCTKALL